MKVNWTGTAAKSGTDLLSVAFGLTNTSAPTYIGGYRNASIIGPYAGWRWVDNTLTSVFNCSTLGCGVWDAAEPKSTAVRMVPFHTVTTGSTVPSESTQSSS